MFPAPEAAALHACRVLRDEPLRDRIALAMEDKHLQHEAQVATGYPQFYETERTMNTPPPPIHSRTKEVLHGTYTLSRMRETDQRHC